MATMPPKIDQGEPRSVAVDMLAVYDHGRDATRSVASPGTAQDRPSFRSTRGVAPRGVRPGEGVRGVLAGKSCGSLLPAVDSAIHSRYPAEPWVMGTATTSGVS